MTEGMTRRGLLASAAGITAAGLILPRGARAQGGFSDKYS